MFYNFKNELKIIGFCYVIFTPVICDNNERKNIVTNVSNIRVCLPSSLIEKCITQNSET